MNKDPVTIGREFLVSLRLSPFECTDCEKNRVSFTVTDERSTVQAAVSKISDLVYFSGVGAQRRWAYQVKDKGLFIVNAWPDSPVIVEMLREGYVPVEDLSFAELAGLAARTGIDVRKERISLVQRLRQAGISTYRRNK